MAVGTLSPDQQTYRDAVAAGTGLDPRVVTAWIGCESPWGLDKPGHNYLNVGPGRDYPDVATAARDAIATVHNGLYPDVLNATTGAAQAAAIAASRWGTGSCIERVYDELAGTAGTATYASITGTGVSGIVNSLAIGPKALGDIIGGALDLDSIFDQVLVVVVSGVFLAAAFGLVILGLNRLTANSKTRQSLEGAVQDGAQIAALAAV